MDGTTPGESFCTGMDRLQGTPSIPGQKGSSGVILSIGWKDSRGVLQSWVGTTPGESFCPGMERLQGSHSVLGRNDSREDIQCL